MAAALQYRTLGDAGMYPEWLRALKGKSGVYAIRRGRSVVYVGESHAGRLYQTITRHFQRWRRKKTWWRDLFSKHDPGLTYPRGDVAVAVRVVPARDAVDAQNALIRRLKPRDNIQGTGEDVPF